MEFLKADIVLEVDDRQAKRSLKKTENALKKSVDKMVRSAQRLADAFKGAFGRILNAAKKLGLVVGGLFLLGLKNSIQYETALVKMTKTLRATGHAAGLTQKELIDNAAALQKLTSTSQTAALEMQSLLLTFKNISGETFNRTTRAVLDLSEGMGQDLKSSVIQLGKALNDPILGISALSRVGIQFTETQKDMIKNMVETNRLAEAQGIILEEIESQFGGTATGIDTTAKALKQLWNSFTDFLKGFTNAFLDPIKNATKALKKFFDDNQKRLEEFSQSMVDALTFKVDAKGIGGTLMELSQALLEIFKKIAITFAKTLNTLLIPVFEKLGEVITNSISRFIPEAFRQSTREELQSKLGGLTQRRQELEAGNEFFKQTKLKSVIKKMAKIRGQLFDISQRSTSFKEASSSVKDDWKEASVFVKNTLDSFTKLTTKQKESLADKRSKGGGLSVLPEGAEFGIPTSGKRTASFNRRMVEKQQESMKKIISDRIRLQKEEQERQKKASAKRIANLRIQRDIFEDLRDVAGEFNINQQLITEQARAYSEALGPEGDGIVARWKDIQIAIARVNASGVLTAFKDSIGSVESASADFFQTWMDGSMTMKDAFKNLAGNIKNIFTRMISELIAKWVLFQVITGLGGNAIGLGLSNPLGGTQVKGASPGTGVAAGPKTFAKGGIATEPSIAGEGKLNEAVVPLPDGRTIPVKMEGGGGSTVVNVINNSSQEVQATEGESFFEFGQLVTEVILTDIDKNGPIRNNLLSLR